MLNRGEIENRIDPIFYSLELFKFLETQSFEIKTISQISNYVVSGFAAGKGDQSFDEEVIQIRPTNIDNDRELIFDRNVYLSRELLETCQTDILKKGEVLFNNTNSQELVGKKTFFNIEGDYFCSNHITRIKTDESQMFPQFLTLILNWYQERKVFHTICTNWNNQSGVNANQLQKIKIPVPPIEIQKQIVENFEKAYAEKKAKEAEAREKLASVDNLVLDALGITLPEPEENTLARRIFFTKSSDISSGRFDAAIHQKKFSLQSKIFPMAKLKDVYAINPRTSFDHLKPETLLSFIPMEAISDKMGRITKRYEREIKESKGYTAFQENDVLWAKITPCMQNGKSVVATNLLNGLGFGSTEYHVFRALNSNANPFYLHSILRLKSLREAAMNYFGGSAGHQRVDVDFFKNLQIPIPPPEVQAEIAERVERIYAEAKKLKDEAAEILRRAKTEVEKMILGE